jgi:hypothetical protein
MGMARREKAMKSEPESGKTTNTHSPFEIYKIPTPEALRSFMAENKLTGADIAHLTGVHSRTARRWIQPSDQKGAIPIPWASWALILILLKKMKHNDLLTAISQWKQEKEGRGLFVHSAAGRPVKESLNETEN